MENLTWFEARALAIANRAPIRRAAWTQWLLYRQTLWLIDEDNALRVVRSTDFTSAEFLAKDWTDTTWTGGYRPPCTAPLPATVLPPLDGIPSFTLDPAVCGGAGQGGTPFAEPGGEEGSGYFPFTLIDSFAEALDLTIHDLGTFTATPPPGMGSHVADTDVTIEFTPGIHEGTRYVLDDWGGDVSGSVNPETVTIDAAKSIEPTFLKYHALTITFVPLPGGDLGLPDGDFTFDPAPDYIDGDDIPYWLEGTEVEITYETPYGLIASGGLNPPASGSGIYFRTLGPCTFAGSPITPTDGATIYTPSGSPSPSFGPIKEAIFTATIAAPSELVIDFDILFQAVWP